MSHMMNSTGSNKYVWKIENFSSLSGETLYSEVFSACGVKWALAIDPKGLPEKHVPKGTCIETQFVIGLSPLGTGSWFVEYNLSVINQNDKEQTRKYDIECEMAANWTTSFEAMTRTELLGPKNGYIINDVCYIKVEIICVMKILKSGDVPEPEQDPCRGMWRHLIQELTVKAKKTRPGEKKEKTSHFGNKKEIPQSVETTEQSPGDLNSTNNIPEENQNTETKDEERKFSISRWFQKRKGNTGKYFNDGHGEYERLISHS